MEDKADGLLLVEKPERSFESGLDWRAGAVPGAGFEKTRKVANMKILAPASVASLVCGILSIVLCWIPVVGLVLGIVAIWQYRQAKQLEAQQPDRYVAGGLAVAGLVCGILGTVASSLCNAIYLILLLARLKTDSIETIAACIAVAVAGILLYLYQLGRRRIKRLGRGERK